MIKTAYEYIGEGFAAIPLQDNKHPLLPPNHPYLYQLVSDDDIDSLFMRAEKIGIVCGAVSDGFYALDFDCHGGENIQSIFNDYMTRPEVKHITETYKLPIFRTPSGGFHIYFRCDKKDYHGHYISKWENGGTMIEIRGHGQYVATFPSAGYKKLGGSSIVKTSRISEEERDILLTMAETYNLCIVKPEDAKKGTGKWPDKFDTSKPIGRYNETEAYHAKDLLIDAGWKLVRTRRIDDVELWLRPGKEQGNGSVGHSATFGKLHNMFYVYTESDKVFTSWKAYSPFDILMKLQFNNEFEPAKKFLEDRYSPKITEVDYPQDDITPEIKDIPNFPIEVFPEGVQKYITALNEALNYSPDFLALSAMFTISICNGNKTKLRVKNGWVAPSVFWFAIVGEPGTMKSHPVGMMISPINQIDRDSKAVYDEQMDEWNKIDKDRKPRKPRFKQMLISDYTLEALHDVHDFNKRGIGLYKDELVGFLNDMNKYRKGSDEQFWLESFNNKSYVVNRVTKEPIFIEDININIIGTIQPLTLNQVVKDFTGNGLVDRFLYSRAESKIYPMSRLDVNNEWIDWWKARVIEASRYYRYTDKNDTQIIEISDEAMDLLYECDKALIDMQNSEGITLNMKGYLNKMKTYLPRFALLMSIFDCVFEGMSSNVDRTHMEKAWKIITYFIESAKSVFNEAEQTMEISSVAKSMFGMTKKEKTIQLYKKGFKQHEICKELNSPREVVSRIISQQKSIDVNK